MMFIVLQRRTREKTSAMQYSFPCTVSYGRTLSYRLQWGPIELQKTSDPCNHEVTP